jgi:hypothetical protein
MARGQCNAKPFLAQQPRQRRAEALAGADDQRGLVFWNLHDAFLCR